MRVRLKLKDQGADAVKKVDRVRVRVRVRFKNITSVGARMRVRFSSALNLFSSSYRNQFAIQGAV